MTGDPAHRPPLITRSRHALRGPRFRDGERETIRNLLVRRRFKGAFNFLPVPFDPTTLFSKDESSFFYRQRLVFAYINYPHAYGIRLRSEV